MPKPVDPADVAAKNGPDAGAVPVNREPEGLDLASEALKAEPAALTGVAVPEPLPGVSLADRAARAIPQGDLIASLNQLAHRVQSIPAGDRAAILREAARRLGGSA